jgi:hypothetical protein
MAIACPLSRHLTKEMPSLGGTLKCGQRGCCGLPWERGGVHDRTISPLRNQGLLKQLRALEGEANKGCHRGTVPTQTK